MRLQISCCDCKKVGRDDIQALGHNCLYRLSRGGERTMWQIAAAITGKTYGTSSQTNKLEMERSGDISDQVSDNNER